MRTIHVPTYDKYFNIFARKFSTSDKKCRFGAGYAAFHSEQEVYLEGTDTEEIYMKMKDRIIENLTVFQKGQSGWRFRSIVSLNVFTAEYKPLKGSSYIPLPSCLSSKKSNY